MPTVVTPALVLGFSVLGRLADLELFGNETFEHLRSAALVPFVAQGIAAVQNLPPSSKPLLLLLPSLFLEKYSDLLKSLAPSATREQWVMQDFSLHSAVAADGPLHGAWSPNYEVYAIERKPLNCPVDELSVVLALS